ncbi:disease resistance protein RPV1 [Eucalyptus grandis]|uniref:disease resistance protein RPV1 n=1 Tax=Eucalyptus grandis TaxID=71139 RepID=UPI00192EB0B2|nr:disease resistance protein RPV1 [Eucalyptus grandis]
MADSRSRKRREVAPSFGREGESRKQEKLKSGAESSVAELSDLVEDKPARLNQDDVILSYLGSDSPIGFVGSLCRCLEADGIHVFIVCDIPFILPEELRLSVSSSNIYIPIFSKAYAYSSECLETLALMVEHMSRSGGKKVILPVFYDVERSDVQLDQKSRYRDALDAHKQRFGDEKVKLWEKALVGAGKVKGWELSSYKSEKELITAIVGEILFKLMIAHNHVSEDLSTGDNPMLSDRTSELEDSQESKIMELLELEVSDVRIVGIHGRDGIGKTALAKIIYDKISLRFDACSFLAEIEETTRQPGGVHYLQTKLIHNILKREHEVASAFEGVRFLKEIFRSMKVLIVLDDVEKASLLKEFVGAKLDWFGCGSRVIVTSKESRVLQGFVARGLAHTYNVNLMDDNGAFNFFWQYAANGEKDELRSYVKIAIEIVKAAKGLPLLVKVFGSFLQHKGLEEWIKFKDLTQQFQEDYQKILSAIYDTLDEDLKLTYLNLASFPPDVDFRIASLVLCWLPHPHPIIWPHHYNCRDEVSVLCRISLIEMDENKLGMHSMLRCLAREIVDERFHDPGTGAGLYGPAIAQDRKKGKRKRDHLETKEAGCEILPSTTFLSLGRANIGRQFAGALSNVWWLQWQGCPQDAISMHLEKNENLVILDLSWSKVTESWAGWNRIKMERLKVLNLTGCGDLLITPSFSCCPNLEILIFELCSRLVHLDPSINYLKCLVTLNLKFCSELSMLPAEMGGMNALEELLIDGTSIRELPASIGKLVQLQILSATNCLSLVRFPSSVCELKALSELALDNAKILELPESIGDLGHLRRLSLKDCHGLGKLPESIGKLGHSLEKLDISGTSVSSLPDSTKNLRRLKVLKLDSCFIREFPLYIGKLISLEEVHASWCRSLEGIFSSDIVRLYSLRELRLRGTRISSLPSEIQFLPRLQTLDLLHCDFLKELPTLPRNLTSLDVDHNLKQKMLGSSNFSRWWHLLQ